MKITMDKSEVVKVLKAKLAEAKKWDAEQERKHKAEEADALERFRAKLRAAMKWDWDTAKKSSVGLGYDERLRCPIREATAIEVVLKLVQYDRKDTIQIFPGSDLQKAILWERPDSRSGATVCD